MSRLACPYCYHRIPANRLWYQCSGQSAPGFKACTAVRDPDRERETGLNVMSRPAYGPQRKLIPAPRKEVCPACHGASGIRVCPCCHTPLSVNFAESTSPLIAMVGAKNTGKTVYLTVLSQELRTGLRRRFGADVRVSGDQPSPTNTADLYSNRKLFEQTAKSNDGRRDPLVFEWRQERQVLRRNTFKTSFLSFYDTAGEDLIRQDHVHDLQYLGAADALILLLDPFMLPEARDRVRLPDEAVKTGEPTIEVLSRITEKLRVTHEVRAKNKIAIPVSVAFAKIDAFYDELGSDHPVLQTPPTGPEYDDVSGQAVHEHIRALLHEWGADDIDTHLRFNYANFRYFAVSALGAQPNYATKEIDPGGIRPHRVDEPLVWLLSKFGVVPVRGQR
ncbi:hypothetical protein [Actinoplanes sp. NPDC089786]|uniref:hypothetical protein n=1 Tax=Actinoplanes sp. NPDC089786 TaxID=3155185 RepID=UPI00342DB6DC